MGTTGAHLARTNSAEPRALVQLTRLDVERACPAGLITEDLLERPSGVFLLQESHRLNEPPRLLLSVAAVAPAASDDDQSGHSTRTVSARDPRATTFSTRNGREGDGRADRQRFTRAGRRLSPGLEERAPTVARSFDRFEADGRRPCRNSASAAAASATSASGRRRSSMRPQRGSFIPLRIGGGARRTAPSARG
jgi:hypothetical protein